MSAVLKKKQCWNCETHVTLSQENCPACGVYLSPSIGGNDQNYNILIPPYRSQLQEDSSHVTKSPYSQSSKDEDTVQEAVPSANIKLVVITILFLFLGSIFLLFSALLFMFSQNGTLVLRWNAEYWHIYLLIAFPLLFFGWKALCRIPT